MRLSLISRITKNNVSVSKLFAREIKFRTSKSLRIITRNNRYLDSFDARKARSRISRSPPQRHQQSRTLSQEFWSRKKYLHGHVSFCLVRTFFDTETSRIPGAPLESYLEGSNTTKIRRSKRCEIHLYELSRVGKRG